MALYKLQFLVKVSWPFKLGWKLTTGLGFRAKYGLDYSKIMSHEHLNSLK